MASLNPDMDTSVTDLSISRERIWVRTNKKNRFQQPVVQDTGWDLVRYDGFSEGFEPGADNNEQRGDGLVSDRKYTGIHWLGEDDPVGSALLKSGGRGAF